MTQGLNLKECLVNQVNYSLSFSLNDGILSVTRVSYEPFWRKIVFTGLAFIPAIGFLWATLYCIYSITADTQYANNCSEALPFLIFLTVICVTARSSVNALYSSKSILDSSQYSYIGVFIFKKIRLKNRKPVLILEICDSPAGGLLEGKIRIQRKTNLMPWNIHVFLFQTITYPSKEIACKNAQMIKEYISKNANSLFSEIKIEY